MKLVAPQRGGVTLASDKTARSTASSARDFVADAFAHLKAIVATKEAAGLLDAAGVEQDAFVFEAPKEPEAAVPRAHERLWDREQA